MIEAIVAPLKPLVLNKVTAAGGSAAAAQSRSNGTRSWRDPRSSSATASGLQPLPEIEFDRDQVAQLFEVRSRPEAHLPVRAGR